MSVDPLRGLMRVYVSRPVPRTVWRSLAGAFEVVVHPSERPPARDELLRAVAGSAGLVTTLGDRVDAELLDGAGSALRVVANYAAGYDNVDLKAASARGVLVTTTPDVLTRATAELTMALVLALLRRVAEGDRLIRSRAAWVWAPTFMLGTGLAGRTLGIVGLGRIGRCVAGLAEAFGMRVVHTSRSGGAPLAELLREADVVSLHCPLTPETYHLIDEAALGAMRSDAVLVNTSRGAVVDEGALAHALRHGVIAGAALDVFEREPSVNSTLLELENVVLAPHLGSATVEAREAMGMLCVEALRDVLIEGRVPRHALNPEARAAA